MNSRERVRLAINHQEADRIPLDLGGSLVTGMNVSMVYKLRQALGLDTPGTPVKVIEPYQMLGEIRNDLADALGVDVVGLRHPRTMFGFRNDSAWKPWTLFDGTPVLVPEGFNTDPEPDGSILMYPEGDKSVAPSGHMPKNGFYFDAIVRQGEVDYDNLDPEDNLQEFGPISDVDLEYFRAEAERLHRESDRAIFADFGGTGFGDIALVPAAWLKEQPRGIRAIEDWYMATAANQDYIYAVFERQCELRWRTWSSSTPQLAIASTSSSSPAQTSARSAAPSSRPRRIARSTSPSTAASTSGCMPTRRGRPSSTRAARSWR